RLGPAMLLRGHPPRVRHPRPLAKLGCAPTLIILWVIANDWAMANDLEDLDEAEGGSQPAEGRELVIVDLGHATMMPPSSLEHRATPPTRRAPRQYLRHDPGVGKGASGVMAGIELSALRVRRSAAHRPAWCLPRGVVPGWPRRCRG